MSPRALWSLVRSPALHLRIWADEDSGIAFDERSGDTFVLTPLGLELLARLGDGDAVSADELAAGIAAGLESSPPLMLAADVVGELRRLQARRLVMSHEP